MDRRTDTPDGSGGASPTGVTSRAAGDDVTGDDQDTRPTGVMAPPRRPPRRPATTAPDQTAPTDDSGSDGTAGGGPSANGAPAAGNGIDASANGAPAATTAKDTASAAAASAAAASAAAADATVADSAPALPADTIGASRGSKPKQPGPDPETNGGDQAPAGDSPAFSFGRPASAPVRPGAGDRTAADPAAYAARRPGNDPSPTAPSGTMPSGRPLPGRPSSGTRPAPAEPPSVSPAAFAWEMPDPPPNSPSSPARTFLRAAGITGKRPAESKTAASSASPGQTAAGQAPATARSAAPSAPKAEPKRQARSAHLTIARVEPWSVMKFSFVVSVVAFVILFVAVSVLYGVLSGLGVFDSLQRVVSSVTSSQSSAGVNARAWFSASKVLGYTALLGSLNIVLITAMSTIGAVVYNLTSRLVGGVEVTLRETE